MDNITLSILNVLGSIDWLHLILAITLIVIGSAIAYVVRRTLYKLLIRFLPKQISLLTAKIVYYALVILFVISALGTLGIDLTGLVIAGGILGIILGFALQSVTANLVSGLFLYWERPLKPGDLVEINGSLGVVVDISAMSTKILGLDGILIRIPNEKVFNSIIKNVESNIARRIDFIIGIAYKEDAERAIKVLYKVVNEHPLVLVNPEPDIFVENLGNSSVDIKVRVWVPSKEWISVKKELLWKMKKALTEAGIEIPFPQHDLWFRNDLVVKVVK